jgi:hypothetical protein
VLGLKLSLEELIMAKAVKAIVFPNGEAYIDEKGIWDSAVERGAAVRLTGKAATAALHAHWRTQLLRDVSPGADIYTRHISESAIVVYCIGLEPDGKPYIRNITWTVARLCGMRFNERHHAIVKGGGGYDKSHQIVADLGRCLWPDEKEAERLLKERTL